MGSKIRVVLWPPTEFWAKPDPKLSLGSGPFLGTGIVSLGVLSWKHGKSTVRSSVLMPRAEEDQDQAQWQEEVGL